MPGPALMDDVGAHHTQRQVMTPAEPPAAAAASLSATSAIRNGHCLVVSMPHAQDESTDREQKSHVRQI